MKIARRLTTAALVLGLATSTVAARKRPEPAPDTYTDEAGDFTFVKTEAWLAAGPTGIGNLDYASGSPVSWDDSEPTGDQGGLTIANNYSTFTGGRYENTLTFEGTFTGNVDSMAMELYYEGPAQGLCGMSLAFDVYIDGQAVLLMDQAAPAANLMEEPAGDYVRVPVILTRLHERMDELGLLGDDTTEHTIFVNAANFYACNEAVFHYDSAAAPARLIFNLYPESKDARAYTEVDVYNPPPPLA